MSCNAAGKLPTSSFSNARYAVLGLPSNRRKALGDKVSNMTQVVRR
jgi:hypothetical protein